MKEFTFISKINGKVITVKCDTVLSSVSTYMLMTKIQGFGYETVRELDKHLWKLVK